jgi:N-acetylmuramic acid 6-phosphate etherase
LIDWEESLYRNKGLVTYMTDRFLLDVLTDTTERAPTFRLPPFRKCDDAVSARSWAFVKNPRYDTRQAWQQVLRRQPRGIDWPASVYQTLHVADELRGDPPRLDNSEIWKFMIGNEPDASRSEAPDSGLAMILVGDEIAERGVLREAFDQAFSHHAARFARSAAVGIGPAHLNRDVQQQFHVACELPASPLQLWNRLAVKLVLNLMSTGTMARMGRVEGNYMSCVETTNKKLVDRGTRLVAHLAGVDYETACYALFEAIDAIAAQDKATKDAPSPVTVAVEKLRVAHRPEAGSRNGNPVRTMTTADDA